MSSSSPDTHLSNTNLTTQSEQRLDHELNNITPVIGTIIKSLFNSSHDTDSSTNTPVASQLLAAIPQLHSILQNLNGTENQIQENLNKSINENLVEFDKLIEIPLVQQFLNTLDANPNEIKKAIHMHNASLHQKLTAFEPIVHAIRNRSEHVIDEILAQPDRLITILFEYSPELVTDFLTKKGFGKNQLENFIHQIPIKSSISKDELIKQLKINDQNNQMNKIEDELQQSSNENFTFNNCLKQLTSTPNLQAFSMIINQLGQSIINQIKK